MAKRTFKTKKKLSGSRTEFRPWKDWETGDILIGKFVGEKEDQYGNPGWIFEVEDAQWEGGKKLGGKKITLNSAGQLNKAMTDNELEPGQWVQVTYNGTAEIEKGKYKGKDSHLIEVDLLEEENEESDEEELEEDEDEDQDDEDDDDL
jgi:hypothetical protein